MITRKLASALALSVATLVVLPGCAVQRGQSTMGEYFDDTKITSEVKAKFVQNKEVDASAISVETLDGVVQLSGSAKPPTEKSPAEPTGRGARGGRSVQNTTGAAIALPPADPFSILDTTIRQRSIL